MFLEQPSHDATSLFSHQELRQWLPSCGLSANAAPVVVPALQIGLHGLEGTSSGLSRRRISFGKRLTVGGSGSRWIYGNEYILCSKDVLSSHSISCEFHGTAGADLSINICFRASGFTSGWRPLEPVGCGLRQRRPRSNCDDLRISRLQCRRLKVCLRIAKARL